MAGAEQLRERRYFSAFSTLTTRHKSRRCYQSKASCTQSRGKLNAQSENTIYNHDLKYLNFNTGVFMYVTPTACTYSYNSLHPLSRSAGENENECGLEGGEKRKSRASNGRTDTRLNRP